MNIRVIGVVLLVILFALASTMLNISVRDELNLSEAYSSGNIKVIQKTVAGTVPHEVEITNNGNKTIDVKKGNALLSTITQDLVIAEEKQITPGSTETLKAYGIEPSKRAVVNTKLLPVNNTYYGVNHVISDSNPYDLQSAYAAQLKIWIIMSGGNLNPYTGEPVAVVETKKITWTQFRQDLADSKISILKTFNITESEIQNLNERQSINPQNWIDNVISWIKTSSGIQ
ncbi:MAG: hypothetical protein PQ975_07490 [Methanobacterium sp.]|jgi:hypothetical protein